MVITYFLQNEHLRYKNYYNHNINMGPDFTLTYYSTDIFPLLNRVMPLFLICGRESSNHFRRASIAEVDLVMIQAYLFLFLMEIM